MNSLRNDRGDEDDLHPTRGGSGDREITLGTTMVLVIFFGLAILCSVFFGFGYSVGHKAAATTASTEQVNGGSFTGFKPAAGSALGVGGMKPMPAGESVTVPYVQGPPPQTRPVVTKPVIASGDLPEEVPIPAQVPARPAPAAVAVAAPMPAVSTVASGPGQSVVQIAAVSHQEDADLLVTTLKRRNYSVAIRQEPQDKLLHVQIGPFANRKDADAMRQRLLADGFNAIVKDSTR